MNKQQLLEILNRHNLKIDTDRITTGTAQGGFHTFECGTGAHADALVQAWREIHQRHRFAVITHVDNLDHPQYGKAFLEVSSVWCAEEQS